MSKNCMHEHTDRHCLRPPKRPALPKPWHNSRICDPGTLPPTHLCFGGQLVGGGPPLRGHPPELVPGAAQPPATVQCAQRKVSHASGAICRLHPENKHVVVGVTDPGLRRQIAQDGAATNVDAFIRESHWEQRRGFHGFLLGLSRRCASFLKSHSDLRSCGAVAQQASRAEREGAKNVGLKRPGGPRQKSRQSARRELHMQEF